MTNPILFIVTEAGKQALSSPSIRLAHVVVGAGKYLVDGSEVAITSEVTQAGIISGGVELQSSVLRFSAMLNVDVQADIYEVGVFTASGILFAVAASNNTPFFTINPTETFAASFGVSLEGLPAERVTVSDNSVSSMALSVMEDHLAQADPHTQYVDHRHIDTASDPHDQYLNKPRFQLLLNTVIPIGYLYHTHSYSNPKPVFDELLGIDTAWRRITGKITVATDPADNYIKNPQAILGQKGTTLAATNERPQAYPLRTTNIFERYNPADAIQTVWNVKADQALIDEGGGINFTVSANNIPDGLLVNWTIKEGILNAASNDVTAPDKTDSGTIILRSGEATISFTTTADDNQVEPLKYVRLTLDAPADLSINVPVNDAGRNETIVHIAESTDQGIVLDDYYYQHSGAYPVAADFIRFIVDAGVDVVAPDINTPAITEGTRWPAGSEFIVENHGRILGRGGDGGRSAYWYGVEPDDGISAGVYTVVPAKNGGNGGTAVKGKFTIENHNLIAGGGGGGGGMGAWSNGDYNLGGGGGTGGGAPFGKRSPNEGTYQMYLVDDTMPSMKAIPPSDTHTYIELQVLKTAVNFTATDTYKTYFDGGDVGNPDSFALTDSQVRYAAITQWIDEDAGTYQVVDSRRVFAPMRMSKDASVDVGGQAGYGGGHAMFLMPYQTEYEQDPSLNHGGTGGGIGTAGTAGVITKFISNQGEDIEAAALTVNDPSAKGGLAGYIKEGAVTITNLSSGTTKGR